MFKTRTSQLLFVIMIMAMLSACQKRHHASVQKIVGSSQSREPLSLRTLTGVREGYYAYVQATFVRDESESPSTEEDVPDSLALEMTIEVGVPSHLVSGRFQLYMAKDVLEGTVTSPYIYFVGGQGGVPGFGGTFLFLTVKGDSYNVYIPPSELKKG